MHVKNKTGRGQFSLEIDILYYIVIRKKNFFLAKMGLTHPSVTCTLCFFNFQFLDYKIYHEHK